MDSNDERKLVPVDSLAEESLAAVKFDGSKLLVTEENLHTAEKDMQKWDTCITEEQQVSYHLSVARSLGNIEN